MSDSFRQEFLNGLMNFCDRKGGQTVADLASATAVEAAGPAGMVVTGDDTVSYIPRPPLLVARRSE